MMKRVNQKNVPGDTRPLVRTLIRAHFRFPVSRIGLFCTFSLLPLLVSPMLAVICPDEDSTLGPSRVAADAAVAAFSSADPLVVVVHEDDDVEQESQSPCVSKAPMDDDNPLLLSPKAARSPLADAKSPLTSDSEASPRMSNLEAAMANTPQRRLSSKKAAASSKAAHVVMSPPARSTISSVSSSSPASSLTSPQRQASTKINNSPKSRPAGVPSRKNSGSSATLALVAASASPMKSTRSLSAVSPLR